MTVIQALSIALCIALAIAFLSTSIVIADVLAGESVITGLLEVWRELRESELDVPWDRAEREPYHEGYIVLRPVTDSQVPSVTGFAWQLVLQDEVVAEGVSSSKPVARAAASRAYWRMCF